MKVIYDDYTWDCNILFNINLSVIKKTDPDQYIHLTRYDMVTGQKKTAFVRACELKEIPFKKGEKDD